MSVPTTLFRCWDRRCGQASSRLPLASEPENSESLHHGPPDEESGKRHEEEEPSSRSTGKPNACDVEDIGKQETEDDRCGYAEEYDEYAFRPLPTQVVLMVALTMRQKPVRGTRSTNQSPTLTLLWHERPITDRTVR